MDQDDTFRKLKQQPFDEVSRKLSAWGCLGNTEWLQTIEDSGWTADEWIKEIRNRLTILS
jgi:hypothetical protein